MKILIVDDDELNRKILEEILSDAGFDTVSAEDGVVALEKLEAYPDITVVLLDRMMPRMDGMEVMQRINEHPQWKHKAVIMQTAAGKPQEVIEGSSTGVYYYLTKPFNEQIVLSIVRAAIDDLKESGS